MNSFSRILILLSGTRLALLISVVGCASAWAATPPVTSQAPLQNRVDQDFEVHIVPVQGNVYMIVGAGANIAVQIGDDGVLLVDSGVAEASDEVIAAIREVTDAPIRYIINTHAHADHVGGNLNILNAVGGLRRAPLGGAGGRNPSGIQIYSHQNTANRMMFPSGDDPEYLDEAVPQFTFLTEDKQMFLNGEAIDLWWHPNAHTNGDVLVYFRRSDVLVTGDLYSPETFPVFEAGAEGSLQGLLNGQNHITDIAVPEFNQEGGTRIIPGHGWVSTESDITEIRDMGTIVRDRIRHMIEQDMTLDQVKAAQPTMDFDPVYGTTTGFWTTDRFIETVYTDLKEPREEPLPTSGLIFSEVPGGRDR